MALGGILKSVEPAAANTLVLEYLLFNPYPDVLYRETSDLPADAGYAEFWFRTFAYVALDKEGQRLLPKALAVAANDVRRLPGERAIALRRLAEVADDPPDVQPLFDLAGFTRQDARQTSPSGGVNQSHKSGLSHKSYASGKPHQSPSPSPSQPSDLLRGAALHGLGAWAARMVNAPEPAKAASGRQAVALLVRACAADEVDWIREACLDAIRQLRPTDSGLRRELEDARRAGRAP
jgi:hypothetical protein